MLVLSYSEALWWRSAVLERESLAHLFVTVFMGLQGFHDGEFCVVLEARRLTAHDLLQDAQSQRSDGVLRTQPSSRSLAASVLFVITRPQISDY